jgi:hypothetical protein
MWKTEIWILLKEGGGKLLGIGAQNMALNY